ncbi:unnamed protein product [Tilletia controversa]|uniref:Uncharacterized protein n=3 Tax=Tilletia TaxID=13289 RepID=A0A8X7SVN0_9BASI|nr:hypothetical protein CF336_g5070 [Tilletia laevis]KAE8198122.1 hypothetical protein CF328_g3642 [Tilletia controversa]KAE8256971.1 hypothetical protein A4X03_0g4873 [Tilletia caries]KAE8196654.1 hypothetical protein CF335_g4807 [Tilletia laevis]KAE8245704.1 hypothetical protein A4X06_0g5479 [Tilletia controversa]
MVSKSSLVCSLLAWLSFATYSNAYQLAMPISPELDDLITPEQHSQHSAAFQRRALEQRALPSWAWKVLAGTSVIIAIPVTAGLSVYTAKKTDAGGPRLASS